MGVFAKLAALSTFVLQNAGVILLMRYSKLAGGEKGYNSAVAVLMTECAKLPICSLLYGEVATSRAVNGGPAN